MANNEGNEGVQHQEFVDAEDEAGWVGAAAGSSGGGIRMPSGLRLGQPNMNVVWRKWEKMFDFYAKATKFRLKDPEVQAAIFMYSIGPEVEEIYENFRLTEAEANDVNVLKAKFREYFDPKGNEVYETYTLRQMQQKEDEPVEIFLTRVETQAKNCSYPIEVLDRMIRDQLVIGINSTAIREKLLQTENLTLEKAVRICKANEKAAKHTQMISEENRSQSAVAVLKKKSQSESKSKTIDCKKCARSHAVGKCPAFGKKCLKCDETGHFAAACAKKKTKKVKEVSKEKSDDSDSDEEDAHVEYLKVWSIRESSHKKDIWKETIECAGKTLVVKIDTGAECNVISSEVIAKMPEAHIVHSKVKRLVAFNGGLIKVLGKVKLPCRVKSLTLDLWFQVIKGAQRTIIDGNSAIRANLLARVQGLKVSDDVFEGLGCVKGFEYDIDLVDNPQFVVHPARQIPYAIRDQVRAELDAMEKLGVIEKCTEAADSVSPLVVVKRNGKIRLCVDLTDVNSNVKRRHFPLRGIEEIAARVAGSTKFTLLDCTKGFWQIKLTPRTTRILTFSTPWGRYSCKRLPFGLASAPEVYQCLMMQLLGDMPNVEVSMDDVLIHAPTEEELRDLTDKVIKKLQNRGLKLNKEKCVFNQNSLKFLGHIVSSEGLKIDPEKVDVVQKLKVPDDKKSLQRFLGMVTYVGKFIPNLSQVTEPLRQLCKTDSVWLWESEHQKTFDKIKQLLRTAPVLRYYDVNKDVTLTVDSSSKAFGAALMQEGQPVAYATKALTKSEQDWPQIEKEAGAMRFAVRKFHDYIWGKKLVIETDHKPLETIFKKPTTNAPPRLKRMLYDVKPYDPIVVYKKGSQIPLADVLSRDCEPVEDTEYELSEDLEVNAISCLEREAEPRMVKATAEDPTMQKLWKIIHKGWPSSAKEVSACIRPYFTFRDELAYAKGIIFKGSQCVIPEKERKTVLEAIHRGHCGIQAALRRARDFVYWPGMSSQITDMIESCGICQQTRNQKQKETILMKPVPTYPFQMVAVDLFHYKGHEYVLMVDSFSGYFDFEPLRVTTAASVIGFCKRKFADHGIPEELHSDGGPQFSSSEFKGFSKEWGFKAIVSSPYFARSNGLVERYVQTAKRLLKRCDLDGQDIKMAILMERNTPRPGLKSPAERLFGRITRNPLVINKDVLVPSWLDNQVEKLLAAREKQKVHADKNAKDHKPFEKGDKVQLWDRGKWFTGQIDEPVTDRSYKVQLDDGRDVRRNSAFFKRSKVTQSRRSEQNIALGEEDLPEMSETVAEQPLGSNMAEEVVPETVEAPSAPPGRSQPQVTTRSGRVVRKPDRLNL
ncbi:uncharacterized protein K02A2.6-like [Lutzomyia longipalpis]|uniref:uncharacterized protein K02A2.6-like n=1 Tax=Lutzomyia longipalpis TaxID=7200 RepID=UPI002483E8A0|nr:uncharacterized protein K02A2.6-like [Lutzomyia longipalpis]